jgi:hypothetical protein
MKNLVVMAFALILGIFVLGSGQRPAHAGAAAAAITATQSEAVKDGGMTKVWYRGGWRGPGWRGGWGPGWGWGPVWAGVLVGVQPATGTAVLIAAGALAGNEEPPKPALAPAFCRRWPGYPRGAASSGPFRIDFIDGSILLSGRFSSYSIVRNRAAVRRLLAFGRM